MKTKATIDPSAKRGGKTIESIDSYLRDYGYGRETFKRLGAKLIAEFDKEDPDLTATLAIALAGPAAPFVRQAIIFAAQQAIYEGVTPEAVRAVKL